MPSRVAVSGPMVEPQGSALFETNSWVGTPASRQAAPPDRAAAGIGRVALVGVDLEQRTAVQQRLVDRIVTAGIVRVDGVSGIRGEEERRGQRRDVAGRDSHPGCWRSGSITSASSGPDAPLRDSLPSSS